jgi:hypothetical protein
VGGKASALRTDVVTVALALEELEVARGALEGGETARSTPPALRSPPAVDRRDCGRRAYDSSDEECP